MFKLLRVAGAALALACGGTGVASAHEGNPNYRSEVARVPTGIEARVLNFDDRIELSNSGRASVVVLGYRGEPYLRFHPDGRVERNRRSPATYLNDDRFAEVEVPSSADPKARPDWEVVARNGRYDWHDHRIHWMSRTPPEKVRESESERVRVFDWKLPLETGGRTAAITGTLTWIGSDDGGPPVAAVLSLAAAVLVGAALVVAVRRRRRSSTSGTKEAW